MTQWADAKLQLSAEDSAEPGPYNSDRAPYQKGILDAISDPSIPEVDLMTSAQVGKTLMVKIILGYHVDQDPAPTLVVMPTLEMGEAFSKDRLAPMIRDTPALTAKMASPKSKDGGNTLLHKRFTGGHITIAGANSPASLASRPIRVLLCDEVDRFPVSAGTEGDPVNLARARTKTFWNRRIVLNSTPTIKGSSRIEVSWLKSDQRRYFVPCPHCGEFDYLQWANVKWPEGHPDEAYYVCPHCAAVLTDADKPGMLLSGAWRATAPFKGAAGFHLNELYSPWRRFGEVASDFYEAKNNPETLKTWTNTSMGELWEERHSGVDAAALEESAEGPIGEVPDWVSILTAGVDTQGDRLSVSVFGWGEGMECAVIDRNRISGDPSNPATFDDLLEFLDKGYEHPCGAVLKPRITAIDSGGHHTSEVLAFARSNANRGVIAVKGLSVLGGPVLKTKPSKVDYRLNGKVFKGSGEVWGVAPNTAKHWINGRLKVSESGRRRIHFCEPLGSDYFRELTAEHFDPKTKRWVNPKGRRNEALDEMVYGLAAAHHPRLRLDVLKRMQWEALHARLDRSKQLVADHREVPAKAAENVPEPVKTPSQAPRNSWIDVPDNWLD